MTFGVVEPIFEDGKRIGRGLVKVHGRILVEVTLHHG
jgi:hypothetical protein